MKYPIAGPGLALPPIRASALFATFLVLLVSGCGRSGVSQISGKISYHGAPVSHGIINFIGSDHQPHGGAIAADGSYACEVPFGSYDVIISAPAQPPEGWHEGEPLPELESSLPEKYGLRQASGLNAVVTDAKQTIDFRLDVN